MSVLIPVAVLLVAALNSPDGLVRHVGSLLLVAPDRHSPILPRTTNWNHLVPQYGQLDKQMFALIGDLVAVAVLTLSAAGNPATPLGLTTHVASVWDTIAITVARRGL